MTCPRPHSRLGVELIPEGTLPTPEPSALSTKAMPWPFQQRLCLLQTWTSAQGGDTQLSVGPHVFMDHHPGAGSLWGQVVGRTGNHKRLDL